MSHWRTLRFEFQAMASSCSLQLDGRDERAMRKAAKAAIAEVHRIESKFSRYRDASVVSRINVAAGSGWTKVDQETNGLLDFADQLYGLSDGLFDITSGVLRRAWDFKNGVVPTEEVLAPLLELTNWKCVERKQQSIRLSKAGMELDFGGFGKEYAVDRAAAVLAGFGVEHALVNLGGDLHALGARGVPELEGQTWQIQIQHPRPKASDLDETVAMLPLARGGLATSGDYERFFIKDGHRYCHILNPHTGWPVNYWQSVSVLAANASAAGAMSTIAMLKGAGATTWLDQQGASYFAVAHDGQVVRANAVAVELPRTASKPKIPPASPFRAARLTLPTFSPLGAT